MKFLIIDCDYHAFQRHFYTEHPGLAEKPYAEQMRARNDSLFGVADFYSRALRELGHAAEDIHTNNEHMQRAWARENGLKIKALRNRWRFRLRKGLVPWVWRVRDNGWFYEILAAQIEHYKPDILLNQAMCEIPGPFLARLKPHFRILLGQNAAPLPPPEACQGYDLVLSSLPNQVAHFRGLGLRAELWRLAFEPRVAASLSPPKERVAVSFVGSLSPDHRSRERLLKLLCEKTDIQVWGQLADNFPKGHPVLQRHRGPVWGREMYRILRDSDITLNQHLDLATNYANNCRLYEATGVGGFLLTDWKENLGEMFEPEKEVACYRTNEECAEKIAWYLKNPEERARIANAGQERTLREHTYSRRLPQLLELLGK